VEAAAAPDKPTLSVSVTNDGKANLNWTQPSGATLYTVTQNGVGFYSAVGNSAQATGLSNNTAYTYVVAATNGVCSSDSNSATVFGCVAPAAVTGLTAAALGDGSIRLDWNAASGAADYEIFYGEASGVYSSLAVTSALTYTFGGQAGHTYYFVVRARNANPVTCASNASAETSVVDCEAPAAPSGASATGGNAVATVAWTSTSTSVRITRSAGTATVTATATGSSYNATGLTNGTTYNFLVAALSGTCSSGAAATSATPCQAPTATATAVATGSQLAVNLAWGGTGAPSYKILRAIGTDSHTQLATTTATAYTDGAVASGNQYSYRVSSSNPSCPTGDSAAVTATPTCAPPTAIGNLGAQAGDASVQLTWSASAGATSYAIHRKLATETAYGTAIATQTAVGYSDQTAVNNTTYNYIVRASNGGCSSDSNQVTATPEPCSQAAPTNVTAAQVGGAIQVSWTAPAGSGLSYTVYRSDNGGAYVGATCAPSGTSCEDSTGLTSGHTYTYQVTATGACVSGYSAPSSGVAYTCVPPAAVTPTATASASTVSLSWTTSVGSTSYIVQRNNPASTDTSVYTPIATTTATTTSQGGLINGTSYWYRVAASNGACASTSTAVSGMPCRATTAAATASSTGTSLRVGLSWTDVGPSSYTIYRGTGSTTSVMTTTRTASGTAYTDTDPTLSTGPTYYYRISSTNPTCSTGESNVVSASGSCPLPAQPVLTATAGNQQVTLGWTTATGVSYSVKRGTASGGPYGTTVPGCTSPTCTDTGLTNDTSYYYVLTATNSCGAVDSAEKSATPSAVDANLIAFYHFDETAPTTTYADSSSHGYNGTAVGTPTSSTGKFGNALTLNGSSQTVTVPGAPAGMPKPSTSAFSVVAWVKTTSATAKQNIFSYNHNYSGGLRFYIESNQLKFTNNDSPGVARNLTTTTTNVWWHVAGTFDGTNWRVYQNGAQLTSGGSATGGAPTLDDNRAYYIGSKGTSDAWFSGSIDEVRYYNRALSATEISNLYQYEHL
jgi:fibronectin type 3 domain-containing protein